MSDAATACRRLLALLAQDAPAEDYQELAITPEAGELVEDALKVRRLLREGARREAELEALYETAGDLSSLRDLEAVLQAIVRRAHELAGTDAAYLMLNDPERGDTYMRVTDGIHTDAFKATRLEMGAGLGGLVAKTGLPYHSTDYHKDTRFRHTVDDVVAAEGLAAIQGVPLKIRDQVIGVLFAANRHARPFTQQEVALLISLAQHAAIAIENASLFQNVQNAVAHLTQANMLVQEHSRAIEQAAALHDRLTAIVLEGGGTTDIAHTLAEMLEGDILLLDRQGVVTATSGPRDCPAAVSLALGRIRLASPDLRRSRPLPPKTCVTPIVAGEELLGALAIIGPPPDASIVRALERAALVTALLLLNERAIAEAEHRFRGEILDDLLSSPPRDLDGLQRRADLLGVNLDGAHTVLVARSANRDQDLRRRLAEAAGGLTQRHSGLAGEHAGNVVMLVPADDRSGTLPQTFSDELSKRTGLPISVGAAAASGGPTSIRRAHQDAVRCLDVMLALDRNGQGATLEGLGVYGLLLAQAAGADLDRFIRQMIGPVLDYDSAKGAELRRTLEAYFACDGNLSRTAATLYVHINTLYQRIDRITTLLGGPGWRHGDQALQVHLALKLRTFTHEAT